MNNNTIELINKCTCPNTLATLQSTKFVGYSKLPSLSPRAGKYYYCGGSGENVTLSFFYYFSFGPQRLRERERERAA